MQINTCHFMGIGILVVGAEYTAVAAYVVFSPM